MNFSSFSLKNLSLLYQGYALALFALIADQLSKLAITMALPLAPIRRKITLTPFLDFVHIRNSGISYGLFSGMGEAGRWLLVLIASGLIALCWVWLKQAQARRHMFALALIIGGGLGNLFDRIVYGAVIDFVSLHAFGYYWYVFNLADLWLTCGIVLFFLAEMPLWKREKNE